MSLEQDQLLTRLITAVAASAAPPAGTNHLVNTAASTNAAVVKATAGNLFEVSISNPTATPISVKFYSKATAPTVGTDVPLITITVAATSAWTGSFGAIGKRFAAGIGIAATALPAVSDTGVAVAGVQVSSTYI